MSEQERNQQIAERICQDFHWQDQSFQIGQCVALLDGRVIATSESLDKALKVLRSIEPDPSRGMIVEVFPPVVDVIR